MSKMEASYDHHRYLKLLAEAVDETKRLELIEQLIKEKARDRLEEYRRHTNAEGALAHAAASLGIDFSRYEMDQPIDASDSQAIQSNIASIAASMAFQASKRDHGALFVGQWVAPFLLLGIYNKLVKQHGSDAASKEAPRY